MRERIAALIRTIEPHDALEAAHKEWIAEWIGSGAPLFRIRKPDVPPRHLVSYCVLFDRTRRELLLGDHHNAGLWLPPGGHVEPDEDPAIAAARELREELGIEPPLLFESPFFVTVTETVGSDNGHIDVSMWYVFRGDSLVPCEFDRSEFKSLQWYELDAIPFSRSDPHMQRFVEKLSQSNFES